MDLRLRSDRKNNHSINSPSEANIFRVVPCAMGHGTEGQQV